MSMMTVTTFLPSTFLAKISFCVRAHFLMRPQLLTRRYPPQGGARDWRLFVVA